MANVIDEAAQELELTEMQVSDDLKQRLSLIIEEEGNRVRKETDRKSAHIIAGARQEYRQRLINVLAQEREKIRREAQ
jgi:hypothetical protein